MEGCEGDIQKEKESEYKKDTKNKNEGREEKADYYFQDGLPGLAILGGRAGRGGEGDKGKGERVQ